MRVLSARYIRVRIKFTFVLPSGSASITLSGAGADVTQVYWSAGGGLTIDYVGTENSAHLRNMSLTTGTAGVGSALVLNQTARDIGPADNALSDLFGITIRGADGYSQFDYWDRGVEINKVSNVNLVSLVVAGPGGSAYSTRGVGSCCRAAQVIHLSCTTSRVRPSTTCPRASCMVNKWRVNGLAVQSRLASTA